MMPYQTWMMNEIAGEMKRIYSDGGTFAAGHDRSGGEADRKS